MAGRRHPKSEVSVVASRSYPASKASGGREETPRVGDQGRPGAATSCPRPGVVTLRSHPEPEARGGSWEEPPGAQGQGQRPGGATGGVVAAQHRRA